MGRYRYKGWVKERDVITALSTNTLNGHAFFL